MRRLNRDRRGSIAITFAVSLIPLIGFAALGTEVGTWYVIKRHAQNAADASAYAGALTLAGGVQVSRSAGDVSNSNGFCDTCIPFPGALQSVRFVITSNSVTATIQQTQPTLLATVLGLSQINIVAQATATVSPAQNLCALSLSTMTIQGNSAFTGGNCSLMTNSNIVLNSAPSLPAGSMLLAQAGCGKSLSNCSVANSNWYMPRAKVPAFMLALDAVTTWPSLSGPNISCKSNNPCAVSRYVYGDSRGNGNLTIGNGATLDLTSGTYIFVDATINVDSGGTLTNSDNGGVNIVLLGSSSLTVKGTVTLTAKLANPLFGGVLNGVLIYDASSVPGNKTAVDTSGGSAASYFGGAMYFPHVDVTWGGNAASRLNCTEIVAYTFTLSGTSNSKCLPLAMSSHRDLGCDVGGRF